MMNTPYCKRATGMLDILFLPVILFACAAPQKQTVKKAWLINEKPEMTGKRK